jgi:hypothetical protein
MGAFRRGPVILWLRLAAASLEFTDDLVFLLLRSSPKRCLSFTEPAVYETHSRPSGGEQPD